MNNIYSVDDAMNQIINMIENQENVTLKIIVGHADEFFMDGNYEKDDDKFVWFQVCDRSGCREKIVAKYNNYEDAKKFAQQLFSRVETLKNNNSNINHIMIM